MTRNARKSGLRVFENNQKSADRTEKIKKLVSEGKVEMIAGLLCGDRKGKVERVVKAVKMCLEQAERGAKFALEVPRESWVLKIPTVKKLLSRSEVHRAEINILAWSNLQRKRQNLLQIRQEGGCLGRRWLLTNVNPITEATKTPKEDLKPKKEDIKVSSEDIRSLPWDYAEAVMKGYEVQKKWEEGETLKSEMCLNVGLESDMCDPQECRDVYLQQEFDDLTGEMLDPDLVKEG